jgi:hypothetical protein
MLKALVFLSVIINLAYSAPYGGYGGSSDAGLGGVSVIHHEGSGVRLVEDGRGLGVGVGVGVGIGREVGLGEVHHGITERIVPLGSSSFAGSSSVVGVGAPVVEQRILGSVLRESPSNGYGQRVEVVTQAPLIVHEVVTQAAYSAPVEVVTQAPLIVQEVVTQAAYSAPVEVVTQAPLIVHEVVTQAAYSAPVEVVTQAPLIVQEVVTQAAYSAPAPALTVAHVEVPVLRHSSGGY